MARPDNVSTRVMSFDDLDENEAYGFASWTIYICI